MKQFRAVGLFWGLVLIAASAFADHQVVLRGIANVGRWQIAFLQVDQEMWAGKAGERCSGGRGTNEFPMALLDVDVTNEVVISIVAGKFYTNSLSTSYRPAGAQNWLHLERINYNLAMYFYGTLRWTPLFGPENAEIKLGFQALHD